MQLLSVTDKTQAHKDFVQVRLNGVDTTGDTSWKLVAADQGLSSPISKEEKKKMLVSCLRPSPFPQAEYPQ